MGLVARRGGTVDKLIGDAVKALFGAPVAHDAVFGVRALSTAVGSARVRLFGDTRGFCEDNSIGDVVSNGKYDDLLQSAASAVSVAGNSTGGLELIDRGRSRVGRHHAGDDQPARRAPADRRRVGEARR